jgi:hypothetical protein
MALNLTTASGVLKDDYQPAVREQLNNDFMLLQQIERNTKDTQGTAAVIAIHVSRNSGVGARAEGGTLPTAGQQTHKQERISLKYNYGRIQISGQTIRHMASDKGAFVRAIESETKGVVTDLKRDVNRQCYTAASGVIGVTTTSPSATTFTAAATVARRLEIGGIYDIVIAGGDGIVYTITVTDIVVSTGVITYTAVAGGSVGSAAIGNRIVPSGVVPSANTELTGLTEIVDSTGTLFNVDPTSFPVWRSYERAVTSAPSDSLFEEALDEIQQTSGEDPNLAIVSYAAARAYANGLKSQKRFAGAPLELKGGFKATSVSAGRNELALMPERDCDADVAYLVNTSHLVQFEASDWEFMDEDGAVLSRVANKDAYEATLYKYHEVATDRRNAHGKITGLVVS